MEKLKLKYTTLKGRLEVKLREAGQFEEEYNETNHKANEVEARLEGLREQLETLEEEKARADERHLSLNDKLYGAAYNTEELRHTHSHFAARGNFNEERRDFLHTVLRKTNENNCSMTNQFTQVTNETNLVEEKLHVEEERLKSTFMQMKELESTLFDLIERMRMLEETDDLAYDNEDVANERIYQMKVLVKQAQVRAERFQSMDAELENMLSHLDDKSQETKSLFFEKRAKLEELIDEITAI